MAPCWLSFFLLLSMKRQNNKIRFFASICAIKSKPSLDRMMWSVVVHSFWNGLTNSFAMNRFFVIVSTKKEIVTHFCTNKTISSNWCHFTNEEIGTCFNFAWNDHMRWTINLTRPFLNKKNFPFIASMVISEAKVHASIFFCWSIVSCTSHIIFSFLLGRFI